MIKKILSYTPFDYNPSPTTSDNNENEHFKEEVLITDNELNNTYWFEDHPLDYGFNHLTEEEKEEYYFPETFYRNKTCDHLLIQSQIYKRSEIPEKCHDILQYCTDNFPNYFRPWFAKAKHLPWWYQKCPFHTRIRQIACSYIDKSIECLPIDKQNDFHWLYILLTGWKSIINGEYTQAIQYINKSIELMENEFEEKNTEQINQNLQENNVNSSPMNSINKIFNRFGFQSTTTTMGNKEENNNLQQVTKKKKKEKMLCDPYYSLAYAYYMLEDNLNALLQYKKILELGKEGKIQLNTFYYCKVNSLLSILLTEKDEKEEGLKYLDVAIDSIPGPIFLDVASIKQRIKPYAEIKMYDKAIDDCNTLLKFSKKPTTIRAMYEQKLQYYNEWKKAYEEQEKKKESNNEINDIQNINENTGEEEKKKEEIKREVPPFPENKNLQLLEELTEYYKKTTPKLHEQYFDCCVAWINGQYEKIEQIYEETIDKIDDMEHAALLVDIQIDYLTMRGQLDSRKDVDKKIKQYQDKLKQIIEYPIYNLLPIPALKIKRQAYIDIDIIATNY
ncbi:hypothetical protein ABK040_002626 [Willaertia magna]